LGTGCIDKHVGSGKQEANVELELSAREESGVAILSVSGEVDLYTAPNLDERLSALIADGAHRIVIDFSDVEFLDSTGLGVVVKTLKRVREQEGSLMVVVPNDRIQKVFRITGLDQVVTLHESLPDAVAASA
jgi:anti-sigma B factor antagonist